jgi:hypothetical protein
MAGLSASGQITREIHTIGPALILKGKNLLSSIGP